MLGVIATLSVTNGQVVKAGDVLLTLEAMKMETAVIAPRDGTVVEVVISTGQSVDANDLLLVLDG
jgi:pyruvate carboxylase